MVPVAGWKETQVSDMDFDTIMEKAYEEYFEGLAEGEEALSFSEFKQALRIRMCSHNDAEHTNGRGSPARGVTTTIAMYAQSLSWGKP